MSKLSNVIMFISGAAIGSVVTWKLVKTKYEQIAQEEIDSVKEEYSTKPIPSISKDLVEVGEAIADGVEEGIEECKNIVAEEGYISHSDVRSTVKIEDVLRPYVITFDQFDEMCGGEYRIEGLTLYNDGILAYDNGDRPVDSIDATVGPDAIHSFGDSEDGSVYVQDDEEKILYEITEDSRNFADIGSPWPVPPQFMEE